MTSPRRSLDDALTYRIIGGAMQLHRSRGPGLFESFYEECLAWELADRGLAVRRQVPVPARYRGVTLPVAYRLDLLIEQRVIVEVKAVEKLRPIVDAQMRTYLDLLGLHTGLVINFNVDKLQDGIRRITR